MDGATEQAIRGFWYVNSRDEAVRKVSPRLNPENPYGGEETDQLEAVVREQLGTIDNKIIADVGCGYGRLVKRLAGDAAGVYGLDISPGMLGEARVFCQQLGNVEFGLAMPQKQEPFGRGGLKGGFDAAYSVLCLQHQPTLESVRSFLQHCHALLCDRGRFVVQTCHDTAIRREWGPYMEMRHEGWHLSESELREELDRAGFDVNRIEIGLYRREHIWAVAEKRNG